MFAGDDVPGRELLASLGCWDAAAARFHGVGTQPAPIAQMVGYLLVLAGTAGLFLAVFEMKMGLGGTLVYLGKISYGLYVFHRV